MLSPPCAPPRTLDAGEAQCRQEGDAISPRAHPLTFPLHPSCLSDVSLSLDEQPRWWKKLVSEPQAAGDERGGRLTTDDALMSLAAPLTRFAHFAPWPSLSLSLSLSRAVRTSLLSPPLVSPPPDVMSTAHYCIATPHRTAAVAPWYAFAHMVYGPTAWFGVWCGPAIHTHTHMRVVRQACWCCGRCWRKSCFDAPRQPR